MTRKNVAVSYLLAFLIAGIAASACREQATTKSDTGNAAPSPLKIGVIFPLTGEAGSYGEKGMRGVNLAVAELQATGGPTIVPRFEDSKADPVAGVTAMQKLVNVDKVPAVVGDIVSAVTLSAAPIAERNHVLLLSPTSSAPAITNAGAYVYRIWPSDLVEGEAIAKMAVERGMKRAAILHLNNEYGTAIADIFTKTFTASPGHSVVANESYDAQAGDYRTVLTKIRQLKPDCIYVAGYYADSAAIFRQARELGLQAQLLGTTAIEDNKFLELAGGSAEGIIYPLATGFDTASTNPRVKHFVDEFTKKYRYTPGWVEAQCYEAVMLIGTAARNIHGTPTGDQLRKYFDSMQTYDGVTGTFRFDSNGDVVKPVSYKTVHNGKFEPLSK